jgi:small subunit ribosomal protein S4
MGDPRKIRKKFSKPRHPWEGPRIEEEKVLVKEYGLTTKQEIWKMQSLLKSYKDQTKKLIAQHNEQAEKEMQLLMKKLQNLNLVSAEGTTDNILGLSIKDIMERRLQTLVFRNKLSRSMKQARQFVLHGHIMVNGKSITSPSHLVSVADSTKIQFVQSSSLSDIDHPERFKEEIKELEKEVSKVDPHHEKKDKPVQSSSQHSSQPSQQHSQQHSPQPSHPAAEAPKEDKKDDKAKKPKPAKSQPKEKTDKSVKKEEPAV